MRLKLSILLVTVFALSGSSPFPSSYAFQTSLTPLQYEIQKQSQRLTSTDAEERRDAVGRLGAMRHPSAARAALPAIRDASAMVRATAASAILALPSDESVSYLMTLLGDKDEFVRREAAFALGRTRNASAAAALIERLNSDKRDSVRGAAAVALGELRDASAVIPLATTLSSTTAGSGKKSKQTKDLFLLRSSARSLGLIGSNAAIPALTAALQDVKTPDDVRRECAVALGLIGDVAALPALRAVLGSRDPYLAEETHNAIRKIEAHSKTRGN